MDSTIACVDSLERNTWHANRGSNGCLVTNPKYLQTLRVETEFSRERTGVHASRRHRLNRSNSIRQIFTFADVLQNLPELFRVRTAEGNVLQAVEVVEGRTSEELNVQC